MRIKHLVNIQQTTSTNDTVRDYPVDTLLISDSQTAGRGRWGRRWDSPHGGLYLSYKCELILEYEGFLSILVGISCHKVLQGLIPCELFVKWPNDVCTTTKKIAGILIEKTKDKNTFIIGIGINLPTNAPKKELLASTIIEQFLYDIEHYYIDQESFLEYFRRYDYLSGEVAVYLPDGEVIDGIVETLYATGELCLLSNTGQKKLLNSTVSIRRV